MRTTINFIALKCLLLAMPVESQSTVELPPECVESTSTIAIIDCLQTQQDVLRQVLSYQQLVVEVANLVNLDENSVAPRDPMQLTEEEADPVIDRINWFDKQMEVYAIVGSPDNLTAHARLDGREYRLQKGDSFRLALVTEVHSRGVRLNISGRSISIGLSGRTNNGKPKNHDSKD